MNSGTKACLEGVLREFFDDQDLYIEEWYQYGGYENTFRIHSSINVSIQQGKGLALILDDLKRASQALSSVIHGFSLDGGLYIAAMIHEHSHETILASMNDFKNLIFPIYPEIGGAYPFRLVGKDGRVAWKSGNSLVHSSESVLTAYVDSETITFEAKVSSEYEYDELIMCVDGSKVLEFGECSGEIDWFEYTHAFSSGGEHKVEWKFVKNGSANEGNDCCWISNIR